MINAKKYAAIYVSKKSELVAMMETAYGKPIPKDATHGFLVALYIRLLKTDPLFASSVDSLVKDEYSNAVDPVSAIAEAVGGVAGAIGGIFTSRQQAKNIEAQAQADSDAALYAMVLNSQGKDNTGKIIIFSGVALLVVGAIITVIILKRKKS